MKKAFYILPAFVLMLFAACSSEDAVTTESKTQINETPENAIGFNAYLNRTTTRAGKAGILDNAALQAGDGGFGVFGYYGNGDLYSENTLPDFMYNQKVTYNSGTGIWTYAPVKYWPNEFGSQAVSTGVDRVTFFAYAPYVDVTPNTGQPTSVEETTGITGLTRNGKTGDPYVRYVGIFEPNNCVDLCYGVAGENFTSSAGEGDGANDIAAGQPYLNVAKPAVGSRLNFDFKHALAMLTVNVDADVDVVGHSTTDTYASDNMTRVWIRSITFNGIAPKGYLNLHSGYWYDAIDNEKISRASVTVYDGRRDGSEANAADTYEYPTGLNGDLVQTAAYNATLGTIQYTTLGITTPEGVTTTNKKLFNGTGKLLVIPANEQMKVTIVYDVETADATLPTYLSDGKTKGITVENKITKEITLGDTPLKLESGKAYTLNLHLGMTGVKFNATVSSWPDATDADDTDLPSNAPSFVAGTNASINVPAAAVTSSTFGLSGITGTTVTASSGSGTSVINGTPSISPSGSNRVVTYSTNANTTVNNRSENITITEADGGATTTTITFNQAAAALGLGISDVDDNGKSITLSSTGTTVASDWKSFILVRERNGVKETLTKGDSEATGVFTATGDAMSATIALHEDDKVQAGDIYTITVQAGDAPAETKTFTIGGIVYSPAVKNQYKVRGDATFSVAPTIYGTGTVSYGATDASSIASIVAETGVVTLKETPSAVEDVVTATLTASDGDGYFYTNESKEATYNVYLSSVNIGGTLNIASDLAVATTIYVGNMPISSATTPAPTSSNTEMITAISITAAPTEGVATVSFTPTANTGAERTATITILGRQFYIKQASGL